MVYSVRLILLLQTVFSASALSSVRASRKDRIYFPGQLDLDSRARSASEVETLQSDRLSEKTSEFVPAEPPLGPPCQYCLARLYCSLISRSEMPRKEFRGSAVLQPGQSLCAGGGGL